jgi:hypothetical protein
MGGGVFISYRGGSHGPALRAVLARRFGPERVFCNSGADVSAAAAVVVVIGPDWLLADEIGWRHIDDARDWIRRELGAAFRAGVAVLPVVTDGARMPVPQQLPADIAALGRCPCWPLRAERAEADCARIADAVDALAVS